MRDYNEFNKRSERINIKNDKKYSKKDYILRDEISGKKISEIYNNIIHKLM